VALFATRIWIWGGGVDAGQGKQYDVAPDGRFLITTVLDSAAAPIPLLMNWRPEAVTKLRADVKSAVVAKGLPKARRPHPTCRSPE
jgi:hypothetical protein